MVFKKTNPFFRFVNQTDRNGPIHLVLGTRCWLWTGSIDVKGYARIGIGKKTIRGARYSWIVYRGIIPKGIQVLHKCDNPACVNPNHLFLGDTADNMKDRDRKQRQARGVKQHLAKLNEDKVRMIRARYQCGCPQNGAIALSRELNVSVPTIKSVVSKETWNHVE